MPKGQYERKPRGHYKVSEEWRDALKKNIRKAQAAASKSPKVLKARSKNMEILNGKRTAQGILSKFPIGAAAGDVFKNGKRVLTILDPVPVERPDGKWEQKFTQSGKSSSYGIITTFSGVCRIVWAARPRMDDLADGATFTEDEKPTIRNTNEN